MKGIQLVGLFILMSLCSTTGFASTPILSAGGVGGRVLPATRDVIWSEPPDLEGPMGTSEVISTVGIETELANDFYFTSEASIGRARWWGGYYCNNNCDDIGHATHWNLRFYSDAGCAPGAVLHEFLEVPSAETFVHCQEHGYPVFSYEASLCGVVAAANTLYWFSAQACDHTYPPQVGRLASADVVGCDTMFRSVFYGYPDWTPAIDVFGIAFDASQEFEYTLGGGGACCLPDGSCVWSEMVDCGDFLHGQLHDCLQCDEVFCDPPQACCFADGQCRMLTDWGCADQQGEPQGVESVCDPNPCTVTPTKDTTWGRIRGGYR